MDINGRFALRWQLTGAATIPSLLGCTRPFNVESMRGVTFGDAEWN